MVAALLALLVRGRFLRKRRAGYGSVFARDAKIGRAAGNTIASSEDSSGAGLDWLEVRRRWLFRRMICMWARGIRRIRKACMFYTGYIMILRGVKACGCEIGIDQEQWANKATNVSLPTHQDRLGPTLKAIGG